MSERIIYSKIIRHEITATEAGRLFGNAPADTQAVFLSGLLDAIDDYPGSWSMQCRFIVDEFEKTIVSKDRRMRLASYLDDLANHLKE